jgi:hypothetical protein
LPSQFELVHSSSHENPGENSRTRAYFLIKAKGKTVEEMLILQIADKTNPQAGPITTPPLKPYTEERMYARNKVEKEGLTIDTLVQLMAWNPEAPSLKPLVKKGLITPHQWALQGQLLFNYRGEHAVLVRYSKDITSFGMKVSEEGKKWGKQSISGNEKKVLDAFEKTFSGMIDSVRVGKP